MKGQRVKRFDCHTELVEVSDNQNRYSVTWDGTNANGQSVPSGIYFYRLSSGDMQLTRKMTLLK